MIENLPEIAAALKREKVNTTADLYRLFIGQMNDFAKSKGKTLQVWEGFKSSVPGETSHGAPPSIVPISTDIVVSPFDCNIYAPPRLAADGYKIINSASPTKLYKTKKQAHDVRVY